MGKRLKWAVAIVLNVCLVLLLLSGCASKSPAPTPAPKPPEAPKPAVAPSPTAAKPAPAPAAAPKPAPAARVPFDQQQLPRFVVAGSPAGGSGWIMTSAWATVISNRTPMKGSVTEVPGFKDSIEPLRRGEVDFFTGAPPSPWAAYAGQYEKEGIKKLRLRLLVGPRGNSAAIYALWVLGKSDIKQGKDLKGKRIGIAAGQVWSPQIPTGVMRANGWTEKDYTPVNYAGGETALDALAEGKVDAVCYVAGSKTLEMSKTVGLRQLALTREETDAVLKISPSLTAGMTPANYMGAGESRWGIVSVVPYWGRADMNEKTTYTMVKAMFENLKEFQAIHERLTDFHLENAADLVWTVPYHPGVIRYYKEKGIWKPEHTAKQKAAIEAERKLYGDVIDEPAFKELGILP